MFVNNRNTGSLVEITPGGTKSTFASGNLFLNGLRFDSSGNLFAADLINHSVVEFTPGGVQSTFVTGLNEPLGLAFDPSGNLFEVDAISNSINEFTPGGVKTTFASGLNGPLFLAFSTPVAAVPEPGSVAVLGVGCWGLGMGLRRRKASSRV